MQSEMDLLVVEDCVLHKADQPLGLCLRAERDHAGPTLGASPWADPQACDQVRVTTPPAVTPPDGVNGPVLGGRARPGDVLSGPYAEVPTIRALLEACRLSPLLRALGEQLPYSARVVEVGCGAGLLTNFLAIAHRTVLGVDDDPEALQAAEAFRAAHGIERAAFAWMGPGAPALRRDFFDHVLATGVLARTTDLDATLGMLAGLVRPGGYLVALVPNRAGLWLSRRTGRPSGSIPVGLTPANGVLQRFRPATMLRAFRAHGLVPITMFPAAEPEGPAEGPVSLFEGVGPLREPSGISERLGHVIRTARAGGSYLLVGRRDAAGTEPS